MMGDVNNICLFNHQILGIIGNLRPGFHFSRRQNMPGSPGARGIPKLSTETNKKS